jgi:hypothetical protein
MIDSVVVLLSTRFVVNSEDLYFVKQMEKYVYARSSLLDRLIKKVRVFLVSIVFILALAVFVDLR